MACVILGSSIGARNRVVIGCEAKRQHRQSIGSHRTARPSRSRLQAVVPPRPRLPFRTTKPRRPLLQERKVGAGCRRLCACGFAFAPLAQRGCVHSDLQRQSLQFCGSQSMTRPRVSVAIRQQASTTARNLARPRCTRDLQQFYIVDRKLFYPGPLDHARTPTTLAFSST